MGSRVVGGVIALIGAVAAVSVYNFYRVDLVKENLGLANQFYVPVVKHLNLIQGKWSAYQRAFEQTVSFRKWGAGTREALGPEPRIHLRKMVEANLVELHQRAQLLSAPEAERLQRFAVRLGTLAEQEPGVVAAIDSYLKTKHYAEAAALYSTAKQDQQLLTQELNELSRDVERQLALLQLSTEQELRNSQNVMLALLGMSLLFSVVVLFRLRRWLLPIVEWTRVAQEIALKGIHRDVRFPQVRRGMPPEISLLTREFTRMGTTVLERERTIHQQKEKLEALNVHLKEQNEQLRRLGSLNERVLNSMTSGLLAINAAGVIEQFNERYCELFRAKRCLILGRSATEVLQELWPPELVNEWLAAQGPVLRTRIHQAGRIFDVCVQQLQAGDGSLLIFEDVTNLIQTEERLEHARKLVLAGNLSSQIAHEVRNPLNSMSLQLEMLEEDLRDDKMTARVKAIADQVDRLDRITRRYLDVGRTISHRKDSVRVHGIIEKCLGFLAHEIQGARTRVEMHFDATKDIIGGDADAISQVLFNLIKNSLEALRDSVGSRTLAVSTSNDADWVRIRIEDSGPGISELVRSRLFEPFVTNKAAGHGLGLSVSRQICIEHGGELKLIEGASGTCFEFALPVLKQEQKELTNAPDISC